MILICYLEPIKATDIEWSPHVQVFELDKAAQTARNISGPFLVQKV